MLSDSCRHDVKLEALRPHPGRAGQEIRYDQTPLSLSFAAGEDSRLAGRDDPELLHSRQQRERECTTYSVFCALTPIAICIIAQQNPGSEKASKI
jgi:hypothetical protein